MRLVWRAVQNILLERRYSTVIKQEMVLVKQRRLQRLWILKCSRAEALGDVYKRQVINNGSIIQPMLIFILPPGGFFVFGMLVALANKLAVKKGKEPAKLGCASCPASASCSKASEGGCE